jgi:hypothetical protein
MRRPAVIELAKRLEVIQIGNVRVAVRSERPGAPRPAVPTPAVTVRLCVPMLLLSGGELRDVLLEVVPKLIHGIKYAAKGLSQTGIRMAAKGARHHALG